MREKILIIDLANIGHITYYKIEKQNEAPNDEAERIKYYSRAILIAVMEAVKEIVPDRVIVVCESKCWRKEYYPEYKANRKAKERPETIKSAISVSADFLDNYTNCSVIKAQGAEGDDIIGIACEIMRENDIVVYSNDGDFNQLLAKENVSIYDPRKRQYKNNYDGFKLFLKFWRGDNGDNIPNISNRRKEATIRDFYENPLSFEEYLEESDEFKNLFERNKKLISLDSKHIPSQVVENIIQELRRKDYAPRKREQALKMANSQNGLLRAILSSLNE